MNVLHSGTRDYVFTAVIVLLGAAVILANRFFPIYTIHI